MSSDEEPFGVERRVARPEARVFDRPPSKASLKFRVKIEIVHRPLDVGDLQAVERAQRGVSQARPDPRGHGPRGFVTGPCRTSRRVRGS